MKRNQMAWKLISIYFNISLFILISFLNAYSRLPQAKVTLKVIDEQGKPIPEADISLGFFNKIINGKTDIEGKFSEEGRSDSTVSYIVKKKGYYNNWSTNHIIFNKTISKIGLLGKYEEFQPWNSIYETVLKKMDNPVTMYVKKVDMDFPKTNIGKPICYDLEKGDWVKPYGKGIISDFIFTFTGEFTDWSVRTEQLVLSFSNKNDGFIEMLGWQKDPSQFKSVKNAPEKGYENNMIFYKKFTEKESIYKNVKENQNFIFRVRSKIDKNGQIIKANYGKIYGDMGFGFTREGKISIIFKYYFNPDGTRNLEYDPKRNLFIDSDTTFDP